MFRYYIYVLYIFVYGLDTTEWVGGGDKKGEETELGRTIYKID